MKAINRIITMKSYGFILDLPSGKSLSIFEYLSLGITS